jgi:hypothetical protein
MPIPINFFNNHPLPSNHVGTVCYTRFFGMAQILLPFPPETGYTH